MCRSLLGRTTPLLAPTLGECLPGALARTASLACYCMRYAARVLHGRLSNSCTLTVRGRCGVQEAAGDDQPLPFANVPRVVAGIDKCASIAAGFEFSAAIDGNGEVGVLCGCCTHRATLNSLRRAQLFTWGNGLHGQLGAGSFANQFSPTKIDREAIGGASVSSIACGDIHMVGCWACDRVAQWRCALTVPLRCVHSLCSRQAAVCGVAATACMAAWAQAVSAQLWRRLWLPPQLPAPMRASAPFPASCTSSLPQVMTLPTPLPSVERTP